MRPPRRDDALIAAALAVPSLVQVLVAPIAPRAVGVLIALATTVPIAWRRTYPAAAALAGTALWCLHTDGFIVLGYVAAFLLFYSLGAHDPDDRRVIAVCAFALVTGAIGTTQSHPVLYEYVTTFFIVVGPTAVGRLARRQREQAERLRDLTEHLERERERTAHLAVDEERARIARELHDVVAHGLSVIAIQSDAAEAALDKDPALARAPLHAIRASAGEALGDMRRLLGVLREDQDGNELTPQPGLAQLDALIERARGAGVQGQRRADRRAARAPRQPRPLRLPDPPGGAHQRPQARPRGARRGAARVGADAAAAAGERPRPRTQRVGTRPRPRRHARAREGPRRRAARRHARRGRLRGPRDPSAAMTTVLIADDQALVRGGFRLILELAGLEVVGEAADGAEALELARRLTPDVVLMDVRMPNMDGIEATRRIGLAGLPTRVLVLTTFDLDEHVYEALRAGASGFLLKDVDRARLVEAVESVARGESLVAPTVLERLVTHYVERPPTGLKEPDFLEDLSARELEVLKLVGRGLSNGEIAEELFISLATVKTHVRHLLQKLNLRDRVQAVVLAHEHGLV